MTLRFILWCLFFIASFISIQLRFRNFPHILFIFLLFIPLVSFLQMLLIRRKLRVSILREKEHILRGEEGTWLLTVINPTLSPLLIQVHMDESRELYPVKGKGELQVKVSRFGSHSGPLDPPTIKVYVQDSLHFFKLKLKRPGMIEKVYVYPLLRKESLKENKEALHQEDGSMGSKALSKHLDEIYQFREIRPGESLKQAHWKLSAKEQKWIIKEYKKDEEPSTLFLAKLSKNLTLRDYLLDKTLSALQVSLSKGQILYLRTLGETLIETQGSTLEELQKFQSQLAHIPFEKQLNLEELLDRHEKKDHQSLVLITETLSPEEVSLLKKLRDLFTYVDIFLVGKKESSTYQDNLEETLKSMQIGVQTLPLEGEQHDT